MEGIRLLKVLFCVTLAASVLRVHSDSFVTWKLWVNPDIPAGTKGSPKFCRPILYYSNTTACFQLNLLDSGDIHPNPGPQCINVRNSDSNNDHVRTLQIPDNAQSHHIRYDLNALYQLNRGPHPLLNQHVWNRVCELGIGRRRRTHRGRKRRIPRSQNPPLTSVSSNGLQLGLWNARSLTNKTHAVTDLVVDNNLDILVITESWLTGDSNRDGHTLANLKSCLPNYDFVHRPRKSSRGGGIFVLYKSTACCTVNTNKDFSSFELLDLTINITPSSVVRLYCIYRPPSSTRNNVSGSTFLDEFLTFLEGAVVDIHFPLLLGDFNIHVDVPNDNFAKSFISGVNSLGFKQHVHEPTHRAGHTLDLLLTRESDDIDHIELLSSLPSDHSALVAAVNLTKPQNPKMELSFRKFRSIDMDSLRDDIKLTFHPLSNLTCPSKVADQYNKHLSTLIDRHAPLQAKFVTIRPKAPWYTDDIKEAKRRRRQAERRLIKSGLCIDKELYRRECELYYECIFMARSTYLKNLIAESNSKQLFNIVKSLSSPNQSSILPDHSSDTELANRFAQFFSDKVSRVVSSFTDSVPVLAITSSAAPTNRELSKFSLLSESEVKKLINSLPSKHCRLDPIPTWLLKDTLDELLPVITKLINLSLSSGHVPDSFKSSLLLPLLKKPNLDRNGLNNYRPIANLPFLGKVLERIVVLQMKVHLERHGMLPVYQSAYRNNHSTETALVKVLNDLLLAVDKGNEAVLVLLDYTAAFDTIDHDLLLHRLEHEFFITGIVLDWIRSYLHNRSQRVVINDTTSASFPLISGVPQGSVVGPLLFLLYTSPLTSVIDAHKGLQHAMYADDTQLYITLKPNEKVDAAQLLSSCLHDVKVWSFKNRLCLNESKSEMMHIYSKFRQTDTFPNLVTEDGLLRSSPYVRDLGVVFDENLTLQQHIKNICKSASFGIFKIGKIRKLLDRPTTEKLIHAFVSSHLDYCNSVFSGLPQSYLLPLQRIQNTAARLVTLSKKSDHITPILRSLHWLPIHHRITFKILILTFKILHGQAPKYLSDLLFLRSSSSLRPLRSTSTLQLTPGPRTKTRYGDRSFSVIAPLLWNNLPSHIHNSNSLDQFKTLLKTHLFNT